MSINVLRVAKKAAVHGVREMSEINRKIKHYGIGGIDIEIPLKRTETDGLYIEDYPDFISEPVYTARGHRILLTFEDACDNRESVGDEPCTECGSCRFFEKVPGTLMGVCKHWKGRKE